MKTDFTKVTGIGKEVKKTIQDNIQDLIHPWQYKDSEIHIVNIDSDITDVETNWNQEIRFRYGFQINDDKSLNIPTMFVQMNGIYSDKAEYRKLIEKMVTEQTIRFKNTDGLFDHYVVTEPQEARRLCLSGDIPAFENVNTSMKKMMIKKLEEFIDKYEGQINSGTMNKVLGNIINMNEPWIVSLLQNFDYCFKNPKIIVENMDDKNFTDVTKYVLIYLYTLGFDILIFSPKGSSFLKNYDLNTITLEKYLPPSEKAYDYRDDDEIRKAQKEEKKEQKKREKERTYYDRVRKRNAIIFGLLTTIGVIAIVLLLVWAVVSEEAEKSDYQKQTDAISFELNSVTMYVNADETPCYSYAVEEAGSVGTYDKDDDIEVTGISDEWVRVNASSSTVYIRRDAVREDFYDIDVENFIMKIKTAEDVSAYTFPNVESTIIHTYDAGDTMNATGYTSDWYQIEYLGDTGFVNRQELKVYEEPAEVNNGEPVNTEEETTETDSENAESEEVADGEVTEQGETVGVGIVLLAILIFFVLCLIFALIML